MEFSANFIIAGVTKAGTTSLFTYLSAHPEICGSSVKEVNFFLPLRFMQPLQPMECYSKFFTHCPECSFKIEASPAYYYGAERVAKSIRKELPGTKVLIIFRNPVRRFISFFNFHQDGLRLPQDMTIREYFERCKALDSECFLTEENYLYFGLLSGRYEMYLDPWVEAFGDDIRVEFFENFVEDPRTFTKVLCRWLGVNEAFFDTYDFQIENKTRSCKNRLVHRFAQSANQYFEPFFRKNIVLKRYIRYLYFKINGTLQKKYVDDELIKDLEYYYAEHNSILARKLKSFGLNINFPGWLEEVRCKK